MTGAGTGPENHIKPAEGRCKVCGMPAFQCDGMSEETLERIRRFIQVYGNQAHKGWSFAKTMPNSPHEYAVRERAMRIRGVDMDTGEEFDYEREFVFFCRAIRMHGYTGRFGKQSYTYLNVDGWRYWTMGNPISDHVEPGGDTRKETTILNRTPLDPDQQKVLRDRNVPAKRDPQMKLEV